MVQKLKASKKGTALLALLIAALTVAYLLVTSALAQPNILSASDDTAIKYNRDRLSYGDIWSFQYADQTHYKNGTEKTVSYYNNAGSKVSADTSVDTTAQKIKPYYYDLSASEDGVSGNPVLTGQGENGFIRSVKESEVSGAAGVAIPVAEGTQASGNRYTVVPDTTGEFYIHAYTGSNDKKPALTCGVLDTVEKYNAYFDSDTSNDASAKPSISWSSLGNGWYRGKIQVNNIRWSAWGEITCDASRKGGTAESSKILSNKISNSKTGNLSVSLEGDTTEYYMNTWSATECWFDTLLVFEFDSGTKLGPISRTGQITIKHNDGTGGAYDGTLSVTNVFGETVSVGSAVQALHAPLVIRATPNEGSKFTGFVGVSADPIGEDTYLYKFEGDGETLTGQWDEQVELPSLEVTRRTADGAVDTSFGTVPMDFVTAKIKEFTTEFATRCEYVFRLKGLDKADPKLKYYYKIGSGEEQKLTDSFTLPVQYDTEIVTLIARGTKDYTATFTAKVTADQSDTQTPDSVAKIGSTYYYFLEDALVNAQSGDTVVLVKDASFSTNEHKRASWTNNKAGYTVKAGVTLLVPFDDAETTVKACDNKNLLSSQHTPYTSGFREFRKLTVPSDITVQVYGDMVVGGRWVSPNGGECMTIEPPFGLVMMEEDSEITVESGGKLFAWGYISGSKKNDAQMQRTILTGHVTVKNGGTVYEVFQFMDFRGGTQTTSINSKGVFPMSQYYIQNIEVPMTFEYGGREYDAASITIKIFSTTSPMADPIPLIGMDIDGLFRLKAGGHLTRSYDPLNDRMIYQMNGEASIGSVTIKMSTEIDSSKYPLPIASNMTVEVCSGTTTVDSDIALLPGTEVKVAENSTLAVSKDKTLFVYDRDEWVGKGYVGSGGSADMIPIQYTYVGGTAAKNIRNKDSLKDAEVTVNGTLHAEGNVCTSVSGANISCGPDGELEIVNGIGTATIKQAKGSEIKTTENTPAQIKNSDGSYTQTAGLPAGTTISARKDSSGNVIGVKAEKEGEEAKIDVVMVKDASGNPAKRYFSYAEALKDGATQLVATADCAENINFPTDKTYTLDVGSFALTGGITNGGTLTLSGTGKINAVTNTGTLTVNGGQFGTVNHNTGTMNITAGQFTTVTNQATATVNGGTFKDVTNSGNGNLTVKAGTFTGTVTNQATANIQGGTFAALNNQSQVNLTAGKIKSLTTSTIITVSDVSNIKIGSLSGTIQDGEKLPMKLTDDADEAGYYGLESNTVTITFHCNGTKNGLAVAAGDDATQKVSLADETSYTYSFTTRPRENYTFLGWATSASAAQAAILVDSSGSATLTPENLAAAGAKAGGTLELYAVYREDWQYKVTWTAKDETGNEVTLTPSETKIIRGSGYTAAAPIPEGYVVIGCNYDAKSGTGTNAAQGIETGWESLTISNISADVTVSLTLRKFDHRVTWKVTEYSSGGGSATQTRAHYITGSADTWTLTSGYKAYQTIAKNETDGAAETAVPKATDGAVQLTGVQTNTVVTVLAKNYNYKVTWVLNGEEHSSTYLTGATTSAKFDVPADLMTGGQRITDVQVAGEGAYVIRRHNKSVTIDNISADLRVSITVTVPTTDATYLLGDMSYQYYRNAAVFSGTLAAGSWQGLDGYAWRNAPGSRSYVLGGETVTVANGSILLVNNSNQVYDYTIKLDSKKLDWASMAFAADGKTGADSITVTVQPGQRITVTARMTGHTSEALTNESLGTLQVTMTPAD